MCETQTKFGAEREDPGKFSCSIVKRFVLGLRAGSCNRMLFSTASRDEIFSKEDTVAAH
jgi:hypothetical protein